MLLLVTDKERQIGRRLTQKEIAQAINVSEPVIGRWMKNQVTQFDADVIEGLCAYFGCEVGDLLYLDANA